MSASGSLKSALPSLSRRKAFAVVTLLFASACGVSSTAGPGATLSPRSTPAQQAGIDDVAFVRTLLEAVGKLYGLDPARVVATGISNGGILTEFLGCSLSERLLGIVPVAGLMRRDTAAGCKPARPISVL